MALVAGPIRVSGSRSSTSLRLLPTPTPTGSTQSTCDSSYENDMLQKACIQLVQQMGDVLYAADSTFDHLANDLENVMVRSTRLSERVSQLASFLAKLDPKKSTLDQRHTGLKPQPPPRRLKKEDISAPCNLFTPATRPPFIFVFVGLKPHPPPRRLKKEDISAPCNLFTPATRPPHVKALYAAAGGSKPPTEDSGCQTDFEISRRKMKSTKPTITLPTETTISSAESEAIYENAPIFVPVDTSGEPLRRMSSQRRSRQGRLKTNDGRGAGPREERRRRTNRSRDPPAAPSTRPNPTVNLVESGNMSEAGVFVHGSRARRRPRKDRWNTIGGIGDWPEQHRQPMGSQDDQALRPKMTQSKSDSFAKPKDMNSLISTVKSQFATLRRKSNKSKGDPLYQNLFELSMQDNPLYDELPRRNLSRLPPSRAFDRSEDSDYSGYNASSSVTHSSRSSPVDPLQDQNKGGSIKKIFRRTLSLRLPKKKESTLTDELYSAISLRPRPISRPSTLAPPVPPKKRHIPLAQSQVMQMAASIHRQSRPNSQLKLSKMLPAFRPGPAGPKRTPSISMGSTDSNWSINGFEINSQSSYREGFKLEYPLECKASPYASRRDVVSRDPTLRPRKSIRTGRSCDSEASVGEDSNFSCDLDGYYTSMHKDSGLWNYKKIEEFIDESLNRLKLEEKTDSTPSSRSLTPAIREPMEPVTFVPIQLPERVISPVSKDAYPSFSGISPIPSEEEKMGEMDLDDTFKTSIPSPLPTFSPRWGNPEGSFPKFSLPPCAEVPVLSETSKQQPEPRFASSPRKIDTHIGTPPIATVRPHQVNGKVITVGSETIPEDIFDEWLLAKFERECGKTTKPAGRSLTPTLDDRVRDVNGNCGFEATKVISSHTMPRKTVRFCD